VNDDKRISRQKILVFQQNGSGEKKIKGLLKHGKELFDLEVFNIDVTLPQVIDDSSEYLPMKSLVTWYLIF